MTRSIGIAGVTPAETVRRLAPVVEARGFRALWINDTPGGDALEKLAVAAEVTSSLGLAAGVVPLDRRNGAEIAARARDLPVDRTRIGVGSGHAPRPLDRLRTGVEQLRAGCDAPVLIGALGPRARALAAQIADGILFNWLTPAAAVEAMAQLRTDADGSPVEGVLYVRTIAEEAARAALEAEAARYGSYPNYAANFARLGVAPMATTLDLTTDDADGFESVVDEVVLRLITATGDADDLMRAVERAAA